MTTLSKVIGIISYLPDDTTKRSIRIQKLINLIQKCKELFYDIPIIIVAQNWTNDLVFENVTLYKYKEPLTIVGARKELRRLFLESNYGYLIMFDDDCELKGTSASSYLKLMDENPDCYINRGGGSLKLFAISKSVFKQVEYDELHLEKGEGFEDWVFVKKLETLIPSEKCIKWTPDIDLEEYSQCTKDPYSTWCNENANLKIIARKTDTYILKHYGGLSKDKI